MIFKFPPNHVPRLSSIPHNTLCIPQDFAYTIVFKCSWKFPRAFENNGICKTWGASKVYYGECENREFHKLEGYFIPSIKVNVPK